MELKMFKPGFTEIEFNDFISSRIVYKMHFLEDGYIYVFWKDFSKLGADSVQMIEEMEKLIINAELQSVVHASDKSKSEALIETMRQEINQYSSNQSEYKTLEEKIKAEERNVLTCGKSVENFQTTVNALKAKAQEYFPLNATKSNG